VTCLTLDLALEQPNYATPRPTLSPLPMTDCLSVSLWLTEIHCTFEAQCAQPSSTGLVSCSPEEPHLGPSANDLFGIEKLLQEALSAEYCILETCPQTDPEDP